MALLFINERHHVGGEVNDLFQLLGLQFFLRQRAHQQIGQPRTRSTQVPNVHDWRRQCNVTHTVTTDLVTRDFNATTLTNDALETDALVLTARTLPGFLWSKDLLAEQSVLFGTKGSVVDGLGLFYFARRPTTDVLGRGEANAEFIELIDVNGAHSVDFLSAWRRASSSSLPRSGRLMSIPNSRVTLKKSSSVSARST